MTRTTHPFATRGRSIAVVALLLVALLLVAMLGPAGPANGAPLAGSAVEGSVVRGGGEPVLGVVVDLFAADGDGGRVDYLRSTTSDADGGYRFDLDSDACHVIVAIAPPGETFVGGSPWDEQLVCPAPGGGVATATSTLAGDGDAPATLGGTITDAGIGAQGVVVDLFTAIADGTRGAYLRSTTTAADGTYRFETAAGCSVVVAIAPAGRVFTNDTPWNERATCVTAGGSDLGLDGELMADSPPPPPDGPRYGSDGEGSPDLSDCTVDTNAADLSQAVAEAPAGSVVCIDAGDYGDHRLVVTDDDRTVKARGRVEIGAVEVAADRVTVDGLRITDRSSVAADAAIEVRGDQNRIANNYIAGAPVRDGIVCSSRIDCSETRIEANTVTAIESIGIIIHHRDNTVVANNVYALVRTATGYDVDAMRFFGTGHHIAENYFHDINEFQSVRDPDGDTPHVDCWQTFTVYESYNPPTNPIVTSDVVIENNYCVRVGRQCLIMENNRTDVTVVARIVFRNNVCETYDSQIVNLKGVDQVTLENNYFGGDPTYHIVHLQLSGASGTRRNSDVIIRNNILQRASSGVTTVSGRDRVDGLTEEANLVLTRPTLISRSADFPDLIDAIYPPLTPTDFDEFAAQALLADVVDAGAAPRAPAALDLAGRPRLAGSAIDIGPFELG